MKLLPVLLETIKEPLPEYVVFIQQYEDTNEICLYKYDGSGKYDYVYHLDAYNLTDGWREGLKITPEIRKIIDMYLDKSQGWEINYGDKPNYKKVDVVYLHNATDTNQLTTNLDFSLDRQVGQIVLFRNSDLVIKDTNPTKEESIKVIESSEEERKWQLHDKLHNKPDTSTVNTTLEQSCVTKLISNLKSELCNNIISDFHPVLDSIFNELTYEQKQEIVKEYLNII